MKKALIGFLVLAVVVVTMTLPARSKVKSDYSGDAITYEDMVVTGSTNSDHLQVFKLVNNQLVKFVDLAAPNNRFGQPEPFFDLKFNIEGGNLYVYTISGYSLYKYDISNLSDATLVKVDTNTYWEWYNRVDKFGENIVTISARGVKVWDKNLNVVDSYDITNDIPYNIRSNGTDKYIFNIVGDKIQIFDRSARQVTKTINVDYRSASGNRSLYFDSYDNLIYVVDDVSAKVFDMNGALKGSFEHSGNPGYDVASSDNEYVYFTNGIGVVKLNKDTMTPVSWEYTGGINGDQGWAMGLKVVTNSSGDKVVVFNNSGIVVLNDNMKMAAGVRAGDVSDVAVAAVKENLFLKLSTLISSTGNSVELKGGGFYPNEPLNIEFGSSKVSGQADSSGRVDQFLIVPAVSAAAHNDAVTAQNLAIYHGATTTPLIETDRVDLKVTGAQSALHYSIAFDIKNIKQ